MAEIRAENKILIRHYGFNNYYAIDRELPGILNISKNGPIGPNAQWIEFCDKFDKAFKNMNILQSVVFQCKLAILVLSILFVFMIVIVYAFPPPLIPLYFIAALVVFVFFLNIAVQGPINTKCIGEAMAYIKEENEKCTIKTISGRAVELSLVHRKLNWLNWDGYEYDSQDCQRHSSIYIRVDIDSNPEYNYNNETTESAEFTTVAGAYVSRPTSNANTVASAYVKNVTPTFPNAKAPDLRDQIEQEKGRSLEPYVSVPMAKATIVDTPTMPPATKVEEDLPSAYVTKK